MPREPKLLLWNNTTNTSATTTTTTTNINNIRISILPQGHNLWITGSARIYQRPQEQTKATNNRIPFSQKVQPFWLHSWSSQIESSCGRHSKNPIPCTIPTFPSTKSIYAHYSSFSRSDYCDIMVFSYNMSLNPRSSATYSARNPYKLYLTNN